MSFCTGRDVKIVANAFGVNVELDILLNESNGLCFYSIAIDPSPTKPDDQVVSFSDRLNHMDGVFLFKCAKYEDAEKEQIYVFKKEDKWFCRVPAKYCKYVKSEKAVAEE